MKTARILLLSLLLFSLSGEGISGLKKENTAEPETTVLMCTGEHAKRYHKKKCRGLNACKGDIKEVSLTKAKELKLTPCKICYK